MNALHVEEVQLRPLVAIDSILEAIEGGQDESCRVARLVHLSVLHVVLKNLDAALASEHLLALAAVLAYVRHDVEGELSDVEGTSLCLVLDQTEQGLDQAALHELHLEEIEDRCGEEGHKGGPAPRDILKALNEGSEDPVALNLVEVLRSEGNQVRDDVEGVGLELEKLWWSPPRDDWVALD